MISTYFEHTKIQLASIFSIRTQNQVSGLMAIGKLISHLQQEREGLIFRIISNGTIENRYSIPKSHNDKLDTNFEVI